MPGIRLLILSSLELMRRPASSAKRDRSELTFVLKFSVTGTVSDYPWCALKTGQRPGKTVFALNGQCNIPPFFASQIG